MTEKAALPRRTVFGVGISTNALGDRSDDPALRRAIHEELLEDLAVLYVDLDDEGAAFVRRLEVDAEGDLVDGWPGGFFDERLAEVLGGRT